MKKSIKIKKNLIGSIIFLILSIIIWYMIPYQIKLTKVTAVNAQTFPRLIIALMGICSLYCLIKEINKIKKREPIEEIEIVFIEEVQAVLMIMLIIFYWLILHWFTFMAASLIFATGMLIFYRCKKISYYIIVYSIIISVTLAFQNLLNVELP